MKKKHALSDDDVDVEFEFAKLNQLKRLKAKAKKFRQRADEPIPVIVRHAPKPKEKPKYTVVRKVGKHGVKLRRVRDGKRLVVPLGKYFQIVKEQRIEGRLLPKVLPKALKKAVPPPGFFAVQCGDDRVQIVYSLSADWEELLCYHHRLKTTMHLRRKDLYPKEKVDEIVSFMKGLDKIHP